MPIEVESSTVAFLSCPAAEPHALSGNVAAEEALQQGCVPLRVEEGLVYEINNAVAHMVQNSGTRHRTHLIVDAAEHGRPEPIRLRPGQQCVYRGSNIHC